VGLRARALLLGIVVAWTTVRAWPTLQLLPTDTDCTLWLLRSRPSNAHVLHWIFGEGHFAGYRPVAALSFWLEWLSGADPTRMLSFRWFDLALHLCAIALVPWLLRSLHPEAPSWAGPLACVLFAFHPAWQEIVPWLSRRSYGLCVVLGMLAVGSGVPAVRRHELPWVGGLFLLGSLLSNELGYVVAGVLGLEALRRRRAAALVPVAAAMAVALACRFSILTDLGGYEKHVRSLDRTEQILREAMEYWCFLPPHPPTAARIATAAVAVLIVWIARRSLATWWLLGTLAIYVLSNEWFYRMAYPAAVPTSLMLAYAVTQVRGIPSALPLAAAFFGIAARSPLLWNIDASYERLRQHRHDALVEMVDALSKLPRSSTVYIASPWSAPNDDNPLWNTSVVWGLRYVVNAEKLLRPDLDVQHFAFMRRPGAVRVENGSVVFPPDLGVFVWPLRGTEVRKESAEWAVSLDELAGPAERTWLYFLPPLSGGLVLVR